MKTICIHVMTILITRSFINVFVPFFLITKLVKNPVRIKNKSIRQLLIDVIITNIQFSVGAIFPIPSVFAKPGK